MRPKALDLFSGAGGMSVGLKRAGFDVTAVDIRPLAKYHRGGTFIQADALTFPLEGYDLIHASPPCQSPSVLRALHPDREYPDLIAEVRERLQGSGALWCIENVPGAPLGGANLTMLCGTMFGLQTPDGRAEVRRHRLFETSFSIPLRPACQHGHVLDAPQGMRRRAMSVTGQTPQTNTVRNQVRTTFSVDDARAAMQIDWMPMKYLSQAIPPAYGRWVGEQAMQVLAARDSRLAR